MTDRRLTGSAERASPARAETAVVTVSDSSAGREVAAPTINIGEDAAPPGDARRGDERAGAGDERAGGRAGSCCDDRGAQQPGDQAAGADDGAGASLLAEELLRLIEVAPAEARRRWERRAATTFYWEKQRRGYAEGTIAALERARGMTIVCATCAALVDLQAARKAARRAGRGELAASDGGAACSRHRRRRRVRDVQERMAAGLLE